jgi:hypothetical protein
VVYQRKKSVNRCKGAGNRTDKTAVSRELFPQFSLHRAFLYGSTVTSLAQSKKIDLNMTVMALFDVLQLRNR